MRPNGCRHKAIFVAEVCDRASVFIAGVRDSNQSKCDSPYFVKERFHLVQRVQVEFLDMTSVLLYHK